MSERDIAELRLLVDEYQPDNSDWGFRRGVIHQVVDRLAALRSLPEREEIARVLTRALFKAEFEVMTSWTQKDMRDAADAVIAHLSGCEQPPCTPPPAP
jgi:3-methyladenine DNA glycosylase Tag